MRHARRLIASIVGVALWCVATSSIAYAYPAPDPYEGRPSGGGGIPDPGVSGWRVVLIVAIVLLLVAAVAGLVLSLRHARASHPSPMAHA